MISPSLKEFKALSRKGNLIALRLDLSSDLETPVSTFLKIAGEEPSAFLLESAEQEERIGRYSFLGFSPRAILKSEKGKTFLLRGRKTMEIENTNGRLLEIMKDFLSSTKLANPETLPSFAGGFVGFLGYENIKHFEPIKLRQKKKIPAADGIFFLVKNFVIFDHFRKSLSIVSLCDATNRSTAALTRVHEAASQRIRQTQRKLGRSLNLKRRKKFQDLRRNLHANLSKTQFESKVEKIKDYIRAGDCIQVVFSQRFDLGNVANDFEIYRALRSINPSPYMFYFRHGPFRLIGSSPEVLVRKIGRRAELRPIAGTRARGKTLKEDLRLEENLKKSKKEMAEHLMLVDLGRNDLGRVCDFKSIKVDDFARVERYSHVMHLVSSVSGRLKSNKNGFDLLKSAFPAGTVTGAPKMRAMEIIDELEPECRGPYAGCLGYFSFNHDMDTCIMIRTIVIQGGRAYVQSGAGVVYDSKPAKEYQETLNKAKAMLQAVQPARGEKAG